VSNVQKAKREANIGRDGMNNRGIALKDRASATHLANSDHHGSLKHIREMLVICNSEHALLLKELSEVIQMKKAAEGDDDLEQESEEWRQDVKKRMDELKKKKKHLLEEEEVLRRSKKQVVDAYYQQVGSTLASTVASSESNKLPTSEINVSSGGNYETSCITEQRPKNKL
jgi:DNA-binding transcriptional MerR regulator